jgi:PemK-like, MazF-like toxin of type II toxin-antitoxin system
MVRFDPTEGVETSKTRPAVITQNDLGKRFSDLTMAAPIVSKHDADLYPTEVLVKAPEGGPENGFCRPAQPDPRRRQVPARAPTRCPAPVHHVTSERSPRRSLTQPEAYG